MQTGSCGFIGYTETSRRYWKAQAHATTVAATKDTPNTPEVAPVVAHRFGECPGCNNGINDESEFVLITTGDNGDNGDNGNQSAHAASVSIRCISCYEVMCMANRSNHP